ncbi:hypothetical protein COW36_06345 [bacterium (Candidatus Blackallbacteria) CG17_big_fil_post_rev_8_21_14_2_50_48_46]|uniref:Glycosyltransferase 2-like domain-containing protein n=1 Tax=bacterium (Candidatus Blackallbacteria) CG17_big_fil_post_rev_8_21_14_2_50_48_46 TaxID=2014261 RepID=A0A2M7G7V6_9BACT|nr:MAG: hypothetical protein COW64_17175 [bacterium (Candidatus Blackallbacteria) CG18_big_fil_WC_8_21_14_2_50_49_26]PIW18145.1 MAG: hypothetical protein COW36_06345 [bacterium (Candidatus Blackallbacteria) CG17_big_fil_post_rev_8_21_14_2_50_48_46]PIW47020.1 MAG: hypothetical protein COW20_13900 [bacterium (Candidatus Blackallbacteria) CG13_big_fil_rev_8_21_14_2_50_49_14]
MLRPRSSPIPENLPGYHERERSLKQVLIAHDYLSALALCRFQLETLLAPEPLISLHIALMGLGWPVLAERLRVLGHLLFPQRFLPIEPSAQPIETDAPDWLCSWLAPQTPMRLSVCMIVRNAEDTLVTALESIADLADEIIVVDTGSQDQTLALAAAFSPQVKVLQTVWQDDFSLARNLSLRAAQGDWILVLDADERLEPEGSSCLRKLLAFGVMGWNLFVFQQKHLRDQAENSFWVQVGRLFRAHPDLRFHGLLHEQLHRFSFPWYLHQIYLPQVILEHSGNLSAQVEKHQKPLRNLLLDRALALPEYQTPYLWFQKAHVLLEQTVPPALPEARDWLEKALPPSVAGISKIPVSATWSLAPPSLALFYLLKCLYLQQEIPALAQTALNYAEWNLWAEGRALAGWGLSKNDQIVRAKPILGSFFEPGLPALRTDLSLFLRLTLEGLLECALAEQDAWLALAYLKQLLKLRPHPALETIQARLFRLLKLSESDMLSTLRALIAAAYQAENWFELIRYFFVALQWGLPWEADFFVFLLIALQKTGYLQLCAYLARTGSHRFQEPSIFACFCRQSFSRDPDLAELPGQWQWYQLLN